MKTITFQHLDVRKTSEQHSKLHDKDQTGLNLTLNNYITALYDGMMLYATAVNESMRDKADIRNGSQITKRMWNRTFKGMYGDITMNAHGDRLNTYSLYDYDPRFDEFRNQKQL
uniref:Receptor ligand binding region domain-containing protein n=1 Tax=Romanomermis culicivorax TaxID=13658 RepID=A0A915L923_ROMCU